MENKIWVALSLIGCVLLGLFGGFYFDKGISADEVQEQIDAAKSDLSADYEANITALKSTISELSSEIIDLNTSTEAGSVTVGGYLLDKLSLNSVFSENLSDREVETLMDSEVEFDGDDYDVEEVLSLNDLILKTNGDDYESNVYLNVPSDGITYSLILDSDLNTSLIDEDETLVLSFLGQEIEVTDWDTDSITILKGEEYLMDQGDSVEVDGKLLKLVYVTEDSVYVEVDGVGREIDEDETKKVNGLEVNVKNVIYSEVGPVTKAKLSIGEEVEETIESGDDYEDDSPWEWVITNNSIGLTLSEEFDDLDDDEGFNAISEGESLCLPGDYVCVQYDGLSEEDFEDYSFKLDDGLLIVKGDFQAGLKDFDKLYINGTKVYEDSDCDDEITGTITLGDSDLELNVTSDRLFIEDIEILANLTDVKVGTKSLSDVEDDYRTDYGSIIKTPEDDIEDNVLHISVPMDELEGNVLII